MELSPWLVYMVMQADTASEVLLKVATVTSAVGGAAAIVYGFIYAVCKNESKPVPKHLWLLAAILPLSLPAWGLVALCPTTKTAAAVVVLPAIANNETLQSEAGELYGIAKEALRDAAGLSDPKPTAAED